MTKLSQVLSLSVLATKKRPASPSKTIQWILAKLVKLAIHILSRANQGRLLVMWLICLHVAAVFAFPVPTALPPHSWQTVGDKTFIHGCNADGLFNASGLALASKFAMLTVEKGQGLAQPGYADGKMTALAAQWKASRKSLGLSDGWAMFYINANFDWNFYRLHTEMLSQPSWSIQMDGGEEGKPCLKRGDISFPQPEEGMLCFNHSIDKCREAFIGQCVNATATLGFDGCFIDSAGFSTHPTQVTKRNFIRRCNSSASAFGAVQAGGIKMLVDLQAAVGSDKLIIAKDSFVGGGEEYVNAVMPMDTFCSCYDCVWSDKKQGGTYAEICQTQIQLAIKLGNRGQVSILHGQVNEVGQTISHNSVQLKEYIFKDEAILQNGQIYLTSSLNSAVDASPLFV
jgi:hypothetical protein